jgi:hypothetical protein
MDGLSLIILLLNINLIEMLILSLLPRRRGYWRARVDVIKDSKLHHFQLVGDKHVLLEVEHTT